MASKQSLLYKISTLNSNLDKNLNKNNQSTGSTTRHRKIGALTGIDKVHVGDYTGVPFMVSSFFLIKVYVTRM